jgi:hypothetical protein
MFRPEPARLCGDDVLRMLVTGGPPVRGGGGMLHYWLCLPPEGQLRLGQCSAAVLGTCVPVLARPY